MRPFILSFFLLLVGVSEAALSPSFDLMRYQVRAQQAQLCMPAELYQMVNNTVTNGASAPPGYAGSLAQGVAIPAGTHPVVAAEMRLARFTAVFTAKLSAGKRLCTALAESISGLVREWSPTLVPRSLAEYEAYCQASTALMADPDLRAAGAATAAPLTHDSPLLNCLRVGMRAALGEAAAMPHF